MAQSIIPQSTQIHVFPYSGVAVRTSTSSVYLDVPLSADGTARTVVFLDPDQAQTVGTALIAAANRLQRMAAIAAEQVA